MVIGMKPKFLVLAPYELNTISAIVDAILLNLGMFIIVGDKNRIIMMCLQHNINYNLFEIHNEIGDVNICIKAEKIIRENDINYVINGNIIDELLKRFFLYLEDKLLSNLVITNFNSLNQFMFFCFPDVLCYDFDDYALAIYHGYNFMLNLRIRNFNVAIFDDDTTVSKKVETELIKQYLTQKLHLDCQLYDYVSFRKTFSKDTPFTKNEKINLVLLKSIYAYKMLFDFLDSNGSYKISKVSIFNNYLLITSDKMMSSDDILFSIFLVNKVFKQVVCKKASG